MNLILIIFIAIVVILFILMFGALFFVSLFSGLWRFLLLLFTRGKEDCPFCKSRGSMKVYDTESGHKKICKKCNFSFDVDDN